MEWETTTVLLARLRDAEDEAWARFAARFRAPIVRFGQRLGLAEEEAEDAAQEALLQFVEAYRAGEYDRARGRLGTWLFTLAFHAIRSARRDAGRAPRQAPDAVAGRTTFFSALPDAETARAEWDEDWSAHVLDACLSRLRRDVNPMQYQAFELSALRDVPADAVAEQLGMSRDSVYQARYRGLRRLQEYRAEFEHVETDA